MATAVGLGLSVATFLVARHAGLAPMQSQLIDTLRDSVDALTTRVEQLERELSDERNQRLLLVANVRDCRDTVADLASENARLRTQLAMGPP